MKKRTTVSVSPRRSLGGLMAALLGASLPRAADAFQTSQPRPTAKTPTVDDRDALDRAADRRAQRRYRNLALVASGGLRGSR